MGSYSRNLDGSTREKIKELKREGKSMYFIADKLNQKYHQVRQFLIDEGLHVVSNRGRKLGNVVDEEKVDNYIDENKEKILQDYHDTSISEVGTKWNLKPGEIIKALKRWEVEMYSRHNPRKDQD